MTLEDADALINASRPGAVDEDGTPLWWIGHPNRSWFEVYKRIGEVEERVDALERPSTQSEVEPVQFLGVNIPEANNSRPDAAQPSASVDCHP